MEFFINEDGERLDVGGPLGEGLINGFILLQVTDRRVRVSLRASLVNPVTLCGAASEIARLDPGRTLVSPAAGVWRIYPGYVPALRYLWELLATEGRTTSYPDYQNLIREAQKFARTHTILD
jgi:hypothetical protein